MGKEALISDIARLAGITDPGVGAGSSVYKSLFTGVCSRFGLNPSGTMPQLARRIVEAADMPYVATAFDSTTTPSGGGSTVTEEGLRQVKAAVQRLIAREP